MIVPHAAGWLDELASRFVVERRFVSRHAAKRRDWLTERLAAVRCLDEGDWFATPRPMEPRIIDEGLYHGQPTQTLTWEQPEISASRALATAARTGPPEIVRCGTERKQVWILLHGWLGGIASRDRRTWPFDALLQRADVVQVILPGHGHRRSPRRSLWPSFPSRNPIANAIGLGVAIAELRQLLRWLRASGYERISMAASSLGANLLALYATVEGNCDRLLLDRPAARMSEPLRRVAKRRNGEAAALLELLEAIYAPVNPLQRSCRIAPERLQILLGRQDRVVGIEAGLELAAHFRVTPVWFPGGHVLPIGRRSALGPLLCGGDSGSRR